MVQGSDVMRRSRCALKAGLACAAALALPVLTAARAQAPPAVDDLLARVGERVAEFYTRAKNVVCTETSRVQPIDLDNAPLGFSRTVESELRIEIENPDVPSPAAILRKILRVNGRIPRESEKKDRAGCTDPNPLSSEPIAFLLPGHRSEYQFQTAGVAKDRNRTALLIDFESIDRRSNPELIRDPEGRDDCFDWSGRIASRGRVWVDASNYDVLRVERRLRGPVDVKVPTLIQRRHRLDPFVVIVRDEVTIRYRTVAFSDPDEVLLLPEAIDTFTMVRGGLQSTRRSQTFSDYRRFVTGGRVISATSDAP